MGSASSRRIGEIADHCLHQNSDHGVEDDSTDRNWHTPERAAAIILAFILSAEPPERVGTGLGVTVVQSESQQAIKLLRLRLIDERQRSLYRDGFAIVPAAIMY